MLLGGLRNPAKKLPVDKIPDPPEAQPDGSRDDNEVNRPSERFLIIPYEKDPDDQDADQPAMERHL